MDNQLIVQVEQLFKQYRKKGWTIATAESCTGGLLGAYFTEVPGSSNVFERGFVTYSNESKTEMLGVDAALIQQHGAVSEEVAEAMVKGVLEKSPADAAIAITGIAGPANDSDDKPVGLVYISAIIRGGEPHTTAYNFEGERFEVRLQAVSYALSQMASLCL